MKFWIEQDKLTEVLTRIKKVCSQNTLKTDSVGTRAKDCGEIVYLEATPDHKLIARCMYKHYFYYGIELSEAICTEEPGLTWSTDIGAFGFSILDKLLNLMVFKTDSNWFCVDDELVRTKQAPFDTDMDCLNRFGDDSTYKLNDLYTVNVKELLTILTAHKDVPERKAEEYSIYAHSTMLIQDKSKLIVASTDAKMLVRTVYTDKSQDVKKSGLVVPIRMIDQVIKFLKDCSDTTVRIGAFNDTDYIFFSGNEAFKIEAGDRFDRNPNMYPDITSFLEAEGYVFKVKIRTDGFISKIKEFVTYDKRNITESYPSSQSIIYIEAEGNNSLSLRYYPDETCIPIDNNEIKKIYKEVSDLEVHENIHIKLKLKLVGKIATVLEKIKESTFTFTMYAVAEKKPVVLHVGNSKIAIMMMDQ